VGYVNKLAEREREGGAYKRGWSYTTKVLLVEFFTIMCNIFIMPEYRSSGDWSVPSRWQKHLDYILSV